MERVIDLDQAVLEVGRRRGRWEDAGLTVAPVTWRDGEQTWPQQLYLERSVVVDPDSFGVVLTGMGGGLYVVLYRGGWTDVDYFVGIDDAGALPTTGIDSAAAFGDQLDTCVSRVFGPLPGVAE
ncbi:hypothetical protein ACFRAR_14570 [Kitasatospora sp. NPDC056651]|uniref:hypothetical protein n=1 Tax=Kitasatospora sp. NPDC056651 TaxID=3345892 RepID=UPI0036A8E792